MLYLIGALLVVIASRRLTQTERWQRRIEVRRQVRLAQRARRFNRLGALSG